MKLHNSAQQGRGRLPDPDAGGRMPDPDPYAGAEVASAEALDARKAYGRRAGGRALRRHNARKDRNPYTD